MRFSAAVLVCLAAAFLAGCAPLVTQSPGKGLSPVNAVSEGAGKHLMLFGHDLARRNDFRDAILGSEIAGDYKPKPRAYRAAAEAFDLSPGECMMVASHSSDLAAAAAVGLHTAHLARAEESPKGEAGPSVPVDIAARSFDDFLEKMGA